MPSPTNFNQEQVIMKFVSHILDIFYYIHLYRNLTCYVYQCHNYCQVHIARVSNIQSGL